MVYQAFFTLLCHSRLKDSDTYIPIKNCANRSVHFTGFQKHSTIIPIIIFSSSAGPNMFRSKSVLTMIAIQLLRIGNNGIHGFVSRTSLLTEHRFVKHAKSYASSSSSLSMVSKTATDEIPSTTNGGNNHGLPRILLKRNRQTKSFRDGSQLIFSGSIAKAAESLKVGDLVQVEVPSEQNSNPNSKTPTMVVGWGLYNPSSLYRVRLILHGLLHPEMKDEFSALSSDDDEGESKILKRILTMNFERSLQTRRALGLPMDSKTDTFRLVNGEGDSVSGLAVDVVGGNVAVIMSSAAWCEIHKSTILESLKETLPDHELIWKTTPSRLKQDGYTLGDESDDAYSGDGIDEPVVCLENGIKYQTFPRQKGQKTSVYCDQRNNRSDLAQLCAGKKVLDLCCYHGGFSLNAVNQGAKLAIGVDSSGDAVDTCKGNAELNKFDEDTISFVKADISDYMRNCEERFDVVVLDPPKLAPSVKALQRASRKYHSLNRDAIKLIDDKGGLLMTCTCSAAMTQKDGGKFFLEMVQQASISAQREVTLLRVSGAAPCHTQSPFSFPAGNYLTAALFMVHPIKSKD
jgi:23S rRNA G2069 N7-methylase RlmK/C1962 C5-methylase RlmI